jgi:sulfide dehydrogenase cytochrome subunit
MAKATMTTAFVGGVLALGLSAAAPASDDLPTGKMLVDTCAGCHGTNGNSVGPASPTISAMDPLVFVDMMKAFAEDETYSTIMGRIARGYTDEELELMGEYLHGIAYQPAKQALDQGLVDKGAKLHDRYCEKCHIEGGKPVPEEEDYYILAGQWTPYLKNAMSDFQNDRREMPKKMRRKLDSMLEAEGEDSLTALYAFYAAYTDFESASAGDDDEDDADDDGDDD